MYSDIVLIKTVLLLHIIRLNQLRTHFYLYLRQYIEDRRYEKFYDLYKQFIEQNITESFFNKIRDQLNNINITSSYYF